MQFKFDLIAILAVATIMLQGAAAAPTPNPQVRISDCIVHV